MSKMDANDAVKSEVLPDDGEEPVVKPDEPYLGTWKDKTAAEEGLGSMQKVMDSQGNELGSLRQQAKMMQQQIDAMGEQEKPAESKPAGPDYGKELKAVQEEKAALDIDARDYQAKSSALDSKMFEIVEASTTEKVLGMAQAEFAKVLGERDIQSTHKDFYRDNPDFNAPEMKTAIQEFLAQDTTRMHDDLSAYYAVKEQMSSRALEEAQTQLTDYERRLNLKAGEEETGQVITKGLSPQQKTKQPKATGADLDKGMMEAWNDAA